MFRYILKAFGIAFIINLVLICFLQASTVADFYSIIAVNVLIFAFAITIGILFFKIDGLEKRLNEKENDEQTDVKRK